MAICDAGFAVTLHYRSVAIARGQRLFHSFRGCGHVGVWIMWYGETPLTFCGLKSALQLALERPSVYEVANRGAPHIVNDKLLYRCQADSSFGLTGSAFPLPGLLQGAIVRYADARSNGNRQGRRFRNTKNRVPGAAELPHIQLGEQFRATSGRSLFRFFFAGLRSPISTVTLALAWAAIFHLAAVSAAKGRCSHPVFSQN